MQVVENMMSTIFVSIQGSLSNELGLTGSNPEKARPDKSTWLVHDRADELHLLRHSF